VKIIFCSDPLNSKVVDIEYEHEYRCARNLGLDVHFISLESDLDGNLAQAVKRIPTSSTPERCIYRGWMMKPIDYERLYHALRLKNAVLINSPDEYTNGHYFPHSYNAIKEATPHSIWFQIKELEDRFDVLFEGMRIFERLSAVFPLSKDD